ncbi:MAG: hypothetical protein BWX88_04243 [Planctomycetes bacterium ADurb.Bin126]|nr:MAG: hypothetical protein BWX88_04243 [Planctomycetes bacterium ADurb.Bin126]HOD82782.1 hypothetical protein [Phycisphaerae bacterium]
MKSVVKTVVNQPSWIIRNDTVELAVTQLGGHMSPVTFCRKTKPIQPYYISPWQKEKVRTGVPVLDPLRGDFFCLPFGGNNKIEGEDHGVHGETATRKWTLQGCKKTGDVTTLTLRMACKVRPAKVTKQLSLVDGQNVVYCRHVIDGFAGRTTLGHHATLAMPDQPESVKIATSPIRFGLTHPSPSGNPAGGEYQAVAPGKRFKSLTAVPSIWKDPATIDCSLLPTRQGFADILGVINEKAFPAWTTATFRNERFVWFSLKDPSIQPATLLWIENHGRHAFPWNGRNCCLGLEDVCGLSAEGLAPSLKPNAWTRLGVPTTLKLSADSPTAVNYIQGVLRVPAGFDEVAEIDFGPDRLTFHSVSGKKARAAVRYDFLRTGCLDEENE